MNESHAPLKSNARLISKDRASTLLTIDQSMTNQHSCPCCSYTLLRHIRLSGLYWRCSHCYQEMPAWS
ncbi:hypothetical protein C7B64_21820 [Merismopedia glauca CCAP 1448/3]|uniref:Uncharacterized protein n=1 Tax=Merismopedia glauca CCAP 1448/3 TaxID=1296344 RepID=A0A2T1BXQ2_9CYAN|nr:hypothetical protein C7B64_21820 [Merismopedia glauca CCAP 1448/3]